MDRLDQSIVCICFDQVGLEIPEALGASVLR